MTGSGILLKDTSRPRPDAPTSSPGPEKGLNARAGSGVNLATTGVSLSNETFHWVSLLGFCAAAFAARAGLTITVTQGEELDLAASYQFLRPD